MLKTAVEKITKGLKVDDFELYAKRVSEGRFVEEQNLDIFLKSGQEEHFLLYIKVFHGRGYYKPWVEFFGIDNALSLGNKTLEYFDSKIENALLAHFSNPLGPGDKIHVEYYDDEETSRQLSAGVPPAASRLGYKLFKLGFTWFKDWYFAEGFKEGGQKLQCEKPIDEESRNRQLNKIHSEVKEFLDNTESTDQQESYAVNAMKRARDVLTSSQP